jgi:hypothetical protein
VSTRASDEASAEAAEAGQAVYSRALLAFYDIGIVWFSNSFLWRCPSKHMRAHYDRHVGARHLDVGVGTGYNRRGIFTNEADSADALRRVLEQEFGSHELEVRGAVGLFAARP